MTDDMPDDIASQLMAHIQAKWSPEARCPLCGHEEWEVADQCFELRPAVRGGRAAAGFFLPVLPVMCAHCGHTVLLNARLAGITPPAPAPAPPAPSTLAPAKAQAQTRRKKKKARR